VVITTRIVVVDSVHMTGSLN